MDPEQELKNLRNKHKNKRGCETCKDMCRYRPCWGTPFEIEALIDAGFGGQLYLDWWVGGFDGSGDDLYMPQPAMVDREGGYAPDTWHPNRQCTFLTESGQCKLHSLKPVEGAVARHDNFEALDRAVLHGLIARCWDTEKGRAVLERWKTSYAKEK